MGISPTRVLTKGTNSDLNLGVEADQEAVEGLRKFKVWSFNYLPATF